MTPAERRTTDRARVGGSRWPAVSTTLIGTPESRPEMDAQIATRFAEFADACSRFSREIVERSAGWTTSPGTDPVRLNMQIARTVFGKWSIDILAFLYSGRAARFQEIKTAIGRISSRVLSLKLSRLERLGLVRRRVLDTRPPSVEYSLTEKGLRVAKLGEPVFLYLRLTDGVTGPDRP